MNQIYHGTTEYPYLYFGKAPTVDQMKEIQENADAATAFATVTNLMSQGYCVSRCPTVAEPLTAADCIKTDIFTSEPKT